MACEKDASATDASTVLSVRSTGTLQQLMLPVFRCSPHEQHEHRMLMPPSHRPAALSKRIDRLIRPTDGICETQ